MGNEARPRSRLFDDIRGLSAATRQDVGQMQLALLLSMICIFQATHDIQADTDIGTDEPADRGQVVEVKTRSLYVSIQKSGKIEIHFIVYRGSYVDMSARGIPCLACLSHLFVFVLCLSFA